ncbi:hypothetical protein HDU83_007190 [Entophlyctis luteolus]|nr:hypothetical protein HDU83_007190 [Entophlyctis luteolus]KAJ3377879.1 hypothetical protein HDU84_008127 [Entophlyctis sp. JEL0112]
MFADSAALQAARADAHEHNIQRALDAMREEGHMDPQYVPCARERFVSVHDQLLLCRVYLSKIAGFIRVFKLDESATAISLFKRFYFTEAVFNYDIKVILVTCIFLAAKIESSYIPLTDFLAKVPAAQRPPVEVIRSHELVVADTVGFDFAAHQWKSQLHGLFLDMQAFLTTAYPSHDTRKLAFTSLVKVYSRSRELAQTAIHTDITFTHTSSQIAVGCFVLAAKQVAATNSPSLVEDVDKYISFRIDWADTDALAALRVKLQSVEECITAQLEFEEMSRDPNGVVQARAKEASTKIAACLNPLFLPQSKV